MSFATNIGLASGIDFNQLISSIRAVNSRPISLILNNRSLAEQRNSALEQVKTALLDLKSKGDALNSNDNFLSMTASSTDGNVVLASASNDAVAGDFGVKVLQLAKTHRIAAQGVVDQDSTAISTGAGTFDFKVGDGATTSVEVTNGMTLNQLRDAINAEDANVRASVVNDGTATNPYRLVLTSEDSGSDNALTIVTNDTDLDFSGTTIEQAVAATSNQFDGTITSSGAYTGANTKNIVIEVTTAGAVGAAQYKVSYDGGLTFTADDAFTTATTAVDVTGASAENVLVTFGAGALDFKVGDRFTIDAFNPLLQQAQNGLVEVDGVQVSRSSNTFKDVIEGVTLTAKKVDSEAQTIKVSNSNFSVQGKVSEFIDSYNRLVEGIDGLTSFNTDTQQRSILFGDSTVSQIISSLRSHLTAAIPGATEYGTLSSVGIKVGQDGKFSLDGAAFNDALNDDLDAVSRLFVRSINSANSSVKFLDSTADTTVGAYDLNITQAAEQAAITGTQVVGGGGIAAAERLVITYNESATIVTLAAGSTLSQIINQLNTAFTDNGLAAQASDDGGKLRISSTAYGSSEEVGVSSDQVDTDPNQLGIGTTKLTDTGADVAGTINGQSVTGIGRELTGPDLSLAEGLRLEISATAPFSTKVTFNKGLSASVIETIDNLTESTSGLFAARESSFHAQIAEFDRRIEDLERRLDVQEEALRKKFVTLETKISTLQSQGNFLLSQLSSLIPANG